MEFFFSEDDVDMMTWQVSPRDSLIEHLGVNGVEE